MRCPRLVEGTFPLSYGNVGTIKKLLLLYCFWFYSVIFLTNSLVGTPNHLVSITCSSSTFWRKQDRITGWQNRSRFKDITCMEIQSFVEDTDNYRPTGLFDGYHRARRFVYMACHDWAEFCRTSASQAASCPQECKISNLSKQSSQVSRISAHISRLSPVGFWDRSWSPQGSLAILR